MRVFFLVFCLLLSGCTTNYQFNKEDFDQKKRGVVFFKVKDQGFNQGFKLENLAKKEGFYANGWNCSKKFYKNGKLYCPYDFISLKPGIYYLDEINLLGGYNYTKFYPAPGLKSNKFVYGGFEVKGGEVLAIGLLSIDSERGIYKFIDDFEVIKQDLKTSAYPELVSKLKRGKFFMPGSTIIDRDGEYKIVDKQLSELNLLMDKLCKEGIAKKEYCNSK